MSRLAAPPASAPSTVVEVAAVGCGECDEDRAGSMDEARDDRRGDGDGSDAVDLEAALAAATRELADLDVRLATDPHLPGAAGRLLAAHHRRAELLLAAGAGDDAAAALLLAARAAAPLEPSASQVGRHLPRLSRQLRELWRGTGDAALAARARRALGAVDDLLRSAVDRVATDSIGLADHPLVDAVTAWCDAPAFDGASAAQEFADATAAGGRALVAAELRAGRREQALATASTLADRAKHDSVDTIDHVEVLLDLAGVALEAEDHGSGRRAAELALGMLLGEAADGALSGRSSIVGSEVVGSEVARAHHLAGCAQVYGEDPEGALTHLQRAYELTAVSGDEVSAGLGAELDARWDDGPLVCDVLADLAYTRRRLGDRHGDAELAAAGLDRALELVRSVGPGWSPGMQRAVARALSSIALAQPRPELAPGPELVALAVRVLDLGCRHDPDDGHLLGTRVQLLLLLAMLQLPSDLDTAAETHGRAMEAFDGLARLEPGSAWTLGSRAELSTVAAALDLRAGSNAAAGRRLREAIDLRRRLTVMRPGSPWALKRVAVAHRELARTAAKLGSRRVAVGSVDAMVAAARRRVEQAEADGNPPDPGAVADLDELLDEGARIGIAVGEQRLTQRVVAQLVALRTDRTAGAGVRLVGEGSGAGPDRARDASAAVDRAADPAVADPAGPDRLHELILALLLAARTDTDTDPGPPVDHALVLLDHLDVLDATHPRAPLTRVEAHHVAANLASRAGDDVGAAHHARAALAVAGVLDPASPAGHARIDQLRDLAAGAA